MSVYQLKLLRDNVASLLGVFDRAYDQLHWSEQGHVVNELAKAQRALELVQTHVGRAIDDARRKEVKL